MTTRMHSSRMRTARSSNRHGGVSTPPLEQAPPRASTPWSRYLPWSRHPPEQVPPQVWAWRPPQPDPPQLPPWVWAWRPPPGLIHLNCPLGCGPVNLQGMLGYHNTPPDLLQGMLGYHLQCMLGYHPPPPPPREQTHTCKNIIFANYVCGR